MNTQFLRYGPFTDMTVNCSLATFQHFSAIKRAFMVTIDGSSKLGNWLYVKPCCFHLHFSYFLDLFLVFQWYLWLRWFVTIFECVHYHYQSNDGNICKQALFQQSQLSKLKRGQMGSSACDRELLELTKPSVFLKQNLWEIFVIILFLHGRLFCCCMLCRCWDSRDSLNTVKNTVSRHEMMQQLSIAPAI